MPRDRIFSRILANLGLSSLPCFPDAGQLSDLALREKEQIFRKSESRKNWWEDLILVALSLRLKFLAFAWTCRLHGCFCCSWLAFIWCRRETIPTVDCLLAVGNPEFFLDFKLLSLPNHRLGFELGLGGVWAGPWRLVIYFIIFFTSSRCMYAWEAL